MLFWLLGSSRWFTRSWPQRWRDHSGICHGSQIKGYKKGLWYDNWNSSNLCRGRHPKSFWLHLFYMTRSFIFFRSWPLWVWPKRVEKKSPAEDAEVNSQLFTRQSTEPSNGSCAEQLWWRSKILNFFQVQTNDKIISNQLTVSMENELR